MAGGMGTRLKVPCEKPLFKLHNKPLIKYVLDNLNSSKLVEKIIIATSPNTPKTRDYIRDFDYEILDTPGVDYLHDLSFILDFFEGKSPNDILLFINADLPFIYGECIDYILNSYFLLKWIFFDHCSLLINKLKLISHFSFILLTFKLKI